MASGLAKKLNLKDGMKVRVVGKPEEVGLGDVAVTTSAKAEGVIVFVKTFADVDAACGPAVDAAKEDPSRGLCTRKLGSWAPISTGTSSGSTC